jgi:hypothetical protein
MTKGLEWLCHSSSGYSLTSHRGGPVSNPGLVKWDLWWTKWRWGRFSPSTSISLANLYSTNFSTMTITYHPGLVQKSSSGSSTQSLTPLRIKKKPTRPITNHYSTHLRCLRLFTLLWLHHSLFGNGFYSGNSSACMVMTTPITTTESLSPSIVVVGTHF